MTCLPRSISTNYHTDTSINTYTDTNTTHQDVSVQWILVEADVGCGQ